MTVFLPCRSGSERIPHKNTRNFADIEGGLLYLKLETLLEVSEIDRIILSTDDQKSIKIAKRFRDHKIYIDIRPSELAQSTTGTDELITYVPQIIEDEEILWTHVTSPFLRADTLRKAIAIFRKSESAYDSIMSVKGLQAFLWDGKRPINYDRQVEKWPRTQTLPKIYEVNSGIFINSRDNYVRHNDRIGLNPFLLELDEVESFDIDWPGDFDLAEAIYKAQKRC